MKDLEPIKAGTASGVYADRNYETNGHSDYMPAPWTNPDLLGTQYVPYVSHPSELQ